MESLRAVKGPSHATVVLLLAAIALAAPAPAQPRPDPAGQPPAPVLAPPSAAELDALRPLLGRGAVLLVRNPDGGVAARITLLTRAHAPLATVHRVVTTPEEYSTFMPTLHNVEVLARHGRRVGFRFHVSAPVFEVSALCAMTVVNPRRVDVAVLQSETGPGGSRWDLTPEGPSDTIVALTTWGDPSQGHWLLRRLARRAPAAVAAMNVSADTVLGLGVARRAEILAGSRAPVRPARGTAEPGPLAPPPPGPWTALARDATIVALGLTPEGSLTQVTVAAWTAASPAAALERLRDVAGFPRVWGSIRSVELVSAPASRELRYRSVVDTPLSHLEGEQVCRSDGNVVVHEGVAGDFAGASHRWELQADPRGGSVVLLTGGSDYNRAGWLTRALMERDPWLMAGFAGSWKIVWLRNLLLAL